MVYAFDTLGYARRLREAGIPQPQAEAHADAAREFVMGELVTKTDLREFATKSDFLAVKSDLLLVKSDMQLAMVRLEEKLEAKIDKLELRMTVKLGVLMAAGIVVLGAMMKLT